MWTDAESFNVSIGYDTISNGQESSKTAPMQKHISRELCRMIGFEMPPPPQKKKKKKTTWSSVLTRWIEKTKDQTEDERAWAGWTSKTKHFIST